MNYEKEPIQVDFSSGERKDKDVDKEKLIAEISTLSSACGAELSEDDLDVKDNKDILFRISEKSAQFGYKADQGISDVEKKNFGARSLVLKAASYLGAAPEAAQTCIDLARQVLNKEIKWGEFEVPDADQEIIKAQIKEDARAKEAQEVKERRRAA